MIPFLLVALACSGADIPREPGLFEGPETLQRAWLPASPDNLMTALVLRHTGTNFLGNCPVSTETSLELRFEGDCDGDYGETWHGSATVREAEDHMDLFDFGLTLDGITWTLDGEIDWSFPDLSVPDEQIDVDIALSWTDGTVTIDATADLEFLLDWNGGRPQVLWTDGEIGLADWGTAGLTTDLVALGRANSCTWPTAGSLALEGSNSGRIAFDGTACDAECPAGTVDGGDVTDLCTGAGLPHLVTPLYDDGTTGTLE